MPVTAIKKSSGVYLLLVISLLLFAGTVFGQQPAEAGRYVNLGVSRYARGNFAYAIKYFDLAVVSNPHLASAYLNRGKAYQAKGDLDAAISDYERAIVIDLSLVDTNPEIAQAYNLRGSTRVRAQRPAEGIRDFTRVINFDPITRSRF